MNFFDGNDINEFRTKFQLEIFYAHIGVGQNEFDFNSFYTG